MSPIVQCLKEKEHNLKPYALTALDDIANHNQDLAQAIVDVSALPCVIKLLFDIKDIKIQVNIMYYENKRVRRTWFNSYTVYGYSF